jgi:NAD(P)H-dependent flavin oxidoreductase YrpB (nitropropane dioxygenase family)
VEILKMGAAGVQMATRFVLAEETNVALSYKEMYQRATKEDVILISSPVGLPGRALRTKLSEKLVKKEAPKPVGCDFCLKKCSLEYCIIQALINAGKGRIDDGIVFTGANVWKIKNRSIRPAAEIVKDIVAEAEAVV